MQICTKGGTNSPSPMFQWLNFSFCPWHNEPQHVSKLFQWLSFGLLLWLWQQKHLQMLPLVLPNIWRHPVAFTPSNLTFIKTADLYAEAPAELSHRTVLPQWYVTFAETGKQVTGSWCPAIAANAASPTPAAAGGNEQKSGVCVKTPGIYLGKARERLGL